MWCVLTVIIIRTWSSVHLVFVSQRFLAGHQTAWSDQSMAMSSMSTSLIMTPPTCSPPTTRSTRSTCRSVTTSCRSHDPSPSGNPILRTLCSSSYFWVAGYSLTFMQEHYAIACHCQSRHDITLILTINFKSSLNFIYNGQKDFERPIV